MKLKNCEMGRRKILAGSGRLLVPKYHSWFDLLCARVTFMIVKPATATLL